MTLLLSYAILLCFVFTETYQQTSFRTLSGHTNWVRGVASLQNGDLASCADDGTIKIWNPVDGTLRKTITSSSQLVTALIVHPNGNMITGSSDTTVKIWSSNGQLLKTLNGHTGTVWALAVLSNGDIASGATGAGKDRVIMIWSQDGVLKKSIPYGLFIWIYKLAALPNGDLVGSFDDGNIRIYSPDGSLKRTILAHPSYYPVRGLAVLPNGDIVTGGDDKTIKIWNGVDGQLKKTFTYHTDAVYSVISLPNGDLASGSYAGKIIIADANGGVKGLLTGHRSWISALTVLPNGDLVSGSGDNTVKIWSPTRVW